MDGAGAEVPASVTGGTAAGAEVGGDVVASGERVAGCSPELSAIATAAPTSSTATTVATMITPGRRYHGITTDLGDGSAGDGLAGTG